MEIDYIQLGIIDENITSFDKLFCTYPTIIILIYDGSVVNIIVSQASVGGDTNIYYTGSFSSYVENINVYFL